MMAMAIILGLALLLALAVILPILRNGGAGGGTVVSRSSEPLLSFVSWDGSND